MASTNRKYIKPPKRPSSGMKAILMLIISTSINHCQATWNKSHNRNQTNCFLLFQYSSQRILLSLPLYINPEPCKKIYTYGKPCFTIFFQKIYICHFSMFSANTESSIVRLMFSPSFPYCPCLKPYRFFISLPLL